jgi:diguanylate cyclase (GGDEF)-like protein/PAS domain S-box-containing protein
MSELGGRPLATSARAGSNWPATRAPRPERARVLSYFFFGGSLLGVGALAFLPLPPDTNVNGTLIALGVALLIGAVLFVGAGRLPAWTVAPALAAGTVIVSLGIYFAGDTSTNGELFYLWVACFGFYFLSRRWALAQMTLVGLGYAAALAARHESGAVTRWVFTLGALTLAGLLIAQLVSRLERGALRSRDREEDLRQAEERFRKAFDDAAVGMALVDLEGRWTRVNDALADLTGYPRRELVGKGFRELTPAEDVHQDERALASLVSGQITTYHAEKRYIHAEGHTVWVSLSVSLVRDGEGRPLQLISQMQDITDRKATERELTERALHDPLTGLPNRLLFLDRVAVALTRMERAISPVAVFFLDLDRFKLINDSLGHAAGDRLLIEAGQRMRTLLRPGDTVARFGGDEFTVLCENTDERAAGVVAERIADTLSSPFSIDGREVFLNASIGIAIGRDPNLDAEVLLRDADTAMYRAKRQGRARIAIFDDGMRLRGAKRLELENELRRAIDAEELRLHYQPEVWLGSGRIHGVEALVHWEHPRRGLIPPGAFIPVAEDNGLIIPLGEWVLREACRQTSVWQGDAPGEAPLSLAVNVSARQLAAPDLCEVIRHVLQDSGLDPASLCLEVTESAAIDVGTETLSQLKELGVRIALDDFGVGFASLNHIRRLPPVDTLKIDRSCIKELGQRPTDTAIVAAMVGMAHSLGMVTVAEGVETTEQVERLRELGCQRGQGDHFSRAVPADALAELLDSAPHGELLRG